MAFLSTAGAGLAADAVRNSAIPIFATDDRTGWQLDRTFGVDDLIAVPGGGPGPITFDKAHPYVPPGRGVPTYRVADLSNPILQDWVKPGMKKANDEVLAGGVSASQAAFWPRNPPLPAAETGNAALVRTKVAAHAFNQVAEDFEFASATSFLIESAPADRRGFYGSWV